MALLVTPPVEGTAEHWRDMVLANDPALDVRVWPEVGDPAEIRYILVGRMNLAELPPLPNLRVVMPMFAGVDHLLANPHLPGGHLVRVGPPEGDAAMTEYCLLHVLRHHRHMPDYLEQQGRREWRVIPQKLPGEQRIGFMGYGQMAQPPARVLRDLGFDVAAWARTPKDGAEVPVFHGTDGLADFLARTDLLVCLLPLTADTHGILNADTFSLLPPGAAVINLGRGAHLVDADLIAALDSGHLSGATLDATNPEPLPQESPLWTHPRVTIMPHTARRVRAHNIAPQVVEVIRRDRAGEAQLWPIDPVSGY